MATQGIAHQVDILVALEINELGQELLQTTHSGVQQIKLKQGQKWNNYPVCMPEMIDDAGEIAHGTKESVKHHKGLTLAFFNKFELPFLFYCI
jgi:hypothetical protein